MATTASRSSRARRRNADWRSATVSMSFPVSARSVSEGELAIVVLVEQVVQQRQERHRLLLDVRDLPLDHLQRAAAKRAPAGRVQRACRGGLCKRSELARNLANCVVLLDEQRGHVAVARIAHAREQLLLLEFEMPADVLREVAAERARELCELAVDSVAGGRRTRERVLDAREQLEGRAMLVVEHAAHRGLVAHDDARMENGAFTLAPLRARLLDPRQAVTPRSCPFRCAPSLRAMTRATNSRNAEAPAAPTSAAARTSHGLSATMATTSSAIAARCATTWNPGARPAASDDGVGGRCLPRAACIDARKGTIRCSMPRTYVRSQPTISAKPKSVGSASNGTFAASASAISRLTTSIAQPTRTSRKPRPRSRRIPVRIAACIARQCSVTATIAVLAAAMRSGVRNVKAAMPASASAASASANAANAARSSVACDSANIGTTTCARPSASMPRKP